MTGQLDGGDDDDDGDDGDGGDDDNDGDDGDGGDDWPSFPWTTSKLGASAMKAGSITKSCN